MPDEIRGLSLTLPYPWLIVAEHYQPGKGKTLETRHGQFTTSYRGRVAIHAALGLASVGGERGLYNLCFRSPVAPAIVNALDKVPGCWGTRTIADQEIDHFDPVGHMLRYAGHILAVATVATAYRFTDRHMVNVESGIDQPLPGEPECLFGDYRPGRVGLALSHVRPLVTPVPARGMLGLWRLPADVREQVEAQL
jgi:hypothetical protein